MTRKANETTEANATEATEANVLHDGFSAEGAKHGYTIDGLAARIKTGVQSEWYGAAFVSAQIDAKVKRDVVMTRLDRMGIASDVASKYVGDTPGTYSRRQTAVQLLKLVGIDLTTSATVLDDPEVLGKLTRVGWSTVYGARDVMRNAPTQAKAWAALVAYSERDATGKAEATTAARQREAKAAAAKAEAAKRHAESIPADAPDEVKAAAERDAKAAAKVADSKAKQAAKAPNARAAAKSDAAHSVEFAADEYATVVAALDAVNAKRKASGKGKATLRIGEFIVAAVTAYATMAEATN